MRCVLIKRHGEYPNDSREPDDSFELEQIKSYGKNMSYTEAIEVIYSMMNELGIGMNSTQEQALLIAIEALQIMHISTVEVKENK